MITTGLAFVLSLSAPTGDGLADLLEEHFLSGVRSEQRTFRKKILATDGLTPKKLRKAIRKLRLWEPQPAGISKMSFGVRGRGKSNLGVAVHVPEGYDPDEPWPLIIALHGQEMAGDVMLNLALRMLGDRKEEFLVASPHKYGAIGFTLSSSVVDRPRQLLSALRRRFHVDSDRVYVLGYSLGSHNAWMAGVMHSDCFAGIIPLATPLQLVGGDILYQELLPNVANTQVLFCWGQKDFLDENGKPRPDGGNAGRNRKLAATLRALGLKRVKTIELENRGHHDVVPPKRHLDKLLNTKRRRFPKKVHQSFRLAPQSKAYWIEADMLNGEPLPHGRLEIKRKKDESSTAATRRTLRGYLGHIGARCKDQTIKLSVRKVGRVNLLLSDDLVDLDKPVTIKRGTRVVFEGKIKRDLNVMLREAARDWDFKRLPVARVVVPLAGKVKFGYPAKKKKTD